MTDGAPPAVRIATLGDLVLDVLVAADARAAQAPRDARGAVRIAPGGSAASFAVGAARAGAQVTFFGCVGDDVAGRLLVAELERGGVVARVRAVPGGATGHVLVLVGDDGASRMISDPGASALLAPEDLDGACFAAADLVHVTGYSWLRPGPGVAARVAVAHARRSEALVSLDPGPAHLIDAFGRARLAAELAASPVDVLLPNRDEAAAMTGEDDPHRLVAALRPFARVVALKLGAAGALVASRDWGDRVEAVPAAPATVVDTTGAGDAFAAAFAVVYASSRDPLAAARAGASAAATVVGRVGAR